MKVKRIICEKTETDKESLHKKRNYCTGARPIMFCSIFTQDQFSDLSLSFTLKFQSQRESREGALLTGLLELSILCSSLADSEKLRETQTFHMHSS